jgi:hypothetical protein
MPHPLATTDFAGRERVEPAVFALTELQKLVSINLSPLNDIVMVANFPSTTDPSALFTFSSAEDAEKIHDEDKSNDVTIQLMKRMKDPFSDDLIAGAGIIRTANVGTQTQATRAWQTGTTTKIILTTTKYGLPANKFQSKFEDGTTANTKKLSVQKRSDPQTLIEKDNLGLAFDIEYTGAAAFAGLTIVVASDLATTLTLAEGTITPGTPVHVFDLTDPQWDTVAKVVAAINDLADYTCSLATGVDALMPSSAFDAAADVDITSSVTHTAALGAIIWYVNETLGEYYTAARATGETAFGDNDTAFVFATGATNATPTITEWEAALTVIDNEDLQGGFIFPVSTNAANQAAILSFIRNQMADQSKTWRTVIATAAGATDQDAKDLAFASNHTRAMVVTQRIQDTDEAGVLADYDPIHLAAHMIGGSASTPITHPLTLKKLNIRGIKDAKSRDSRVDLLKNGVTVVRLERNFGYVVAMAVSSSLDNKRMPRVWQDSVAGDFLHNNVQIPLRRFAGTWSRADSTERTEMFVGRVLELSELAGIISQGEDDAGAPLPAFDPPRATLSAGLLNVNWRAYIGGELDFIGVRGSVEYQSFGVAVPI